jgi:hypothetical protein
MRAFHSSTPIRMVVLAVLGVVTTLGSIAIGSAVASATPGVASQIVLTSSTGPLLLQGQPTTLTATIEDSSGTTVTGSTAAVTFAKVGGTGSVSGLGTFNAVGGVATDVITGATFNTVNLQAVAVVGTSTLNSNIILANYNAFHGISVLKGCNSVTLIGQPLYCVYEIVNDVDTANDTITINKIVDKVLAKDGTVTSSNLLPVLTLDLSGGASCNLLQTVCTLPAGSSIVSESNSFYTVAPDDFLLPGNQLDDQVTVSWNDVCDGGSGNCSTGNQASSSPSSTTVQQYTPVVSTTLTPPGPVLVGTPVSDQAALTGTNFDAGGSVSYAVYSDSGCTNQVATLGTEPVTDGTVPSSTAWTSTAGNFWFQATYSGDVSEPARCSQPLHQ